MRQDLWQHGQIGEVYAHEVESDAGFVHVLLVKDWDFRISLAKVGQDYAVRSSRCAYCYGFLRCAVVPRDRFVLHAVLKRRLKQNKNQDSLLDRQHGHNLTPFSMLK